MSTSSESSLICVIFGHHCPYYNYRVQSAGEVFCPSAPESAELQGEGLSFEVGVLFVNAWQASKKKNPGNQFV